MAKTNWAFGLGLTGLYSGPTKRELAMQDLAIYEKLSNEKRRDIERDELAQVRMKTYHDEINKISDSLLANDKAKINAISRQQSSIIKDALRENGGSYAKFFANGGHTIMQQYQDSVIRNPAVAQYMENSKNAKYLLQAQSNKDLVNRIYPTDIENMRKYMETGEGNITYSGLMPEFRMPNVDAYRDGEEIPIQDFIDMNIKELKIAFMTEYPQYSYDQITDGMIDFYAKKNFPHVGIGTGKNYNEAIKAAAQANKYNQEAEKLARQNNKDDDDGGSKNSRTRANQSVFTETRVVDGLLVNANTGVPMDIKTSKDSFLWTNAYNNFTTSEIPVTFGDVSKGNIQELREQNDLKIIAGSSDPQFYNNYSSERFQSGYSKPSNAIILDSLNPALDKIVTDVLGAHYVSRNLDGSYSISFKGNEYNFRGYQINDDRRAGLKYVSYDLAKLNNDSYIIGTPILGWTGVSGNNAHDGKPTTNLIMEYKNDKIGEDGIGEKFKEFAPTLDENTKLQPAVLLPVTPKNNSSSAQYFIPIPMDNMTVRGILNENAALQYGDVMRNDAKQEQAKQQVEHDLKISNIARNDMMGMLSETIFPTKYMRDESKLYSVGGKSVLPNARKAYYATMANVLMPGEVAQSISAYQQKQPMPYLNDLMGIVEESGETFTDFINLTKEVANVRSEKNGRVNIMIDNKYESYDPVEFYNKFIDPYLTGRNQSPEAEMEFMKYIKEFWTNSRDYDLPINGGYTFMDMWLNFAGSDFKNY